MKTAIYLCIAVSLFYLYNPKTIGAQSCCYDDSHCVSPNVCYTAGTGPGSNPAEPACQYYPNFRPGYCRPATPWNPDFTIPKPTQIIELQTFNYNYLGRFGIGSFISDIIRYVFAFSGLALLLYLIYGAFQMVSAMGEAAKIAAGSKIITNALIGFAVLFVSFWIMQLLELVLGLNII